MRFETRTPEQIAEWIRQRAIAIATDEGEQIDPPAPGIQRLREPQGLGIQWALSDYQNSRGLGYIQVAAAEASAMFDLSPED